MVMEGLAMSDRYTSWRESLVQRLKVELDDLGREASWNAALDRLRQLQSELRRGADDSRRLSAADETMRRRQSFQGRIAELNAQDEPTTQALQALKCGNDEFSGLCGSRVMTLAGDEASKICGDLFAGDRFSRDRALRWVLRGLRPEHAVKKVRLDNEKFGTERKRA
jgi:hypothetical protein